MFVTFKKAMLRTGILAGLILIFACSVAFATEVPVSFELELDHYDFNGPDDVEVTIRLTNIGGVDWPEEVALETPDGNVVTHFNLAPGETAAWTGIWPVTSQQLESGYVAFSAVIPILYEDGDYFTERKYFSVQITYDPSSEETVPSDAWEFQTWTVPALPITKDLTPTFTREEIFLDNNQPLVLENGRDFSDGMAWIKPQEDKWLCIDKDGHVRFALEQNIVPVSDFSHGIAVLSGDMVVDKNGVILASPGENSYDQIITQVFKPSLFHGEGMESIKHSDQPEPWITNATIDGAVFALKHFDTFDMTETWAGILGYNGRWLCQPNSLLAEFLQTREGSWNSSNPTFEVHWLGEGWIRRTITSFESDCANHLYNIYTGRYYSLPDNVFDFENAKYVIGNLHDDAFTGDFYFSNVKNNHMLVYMDHRAIMYSYNPQQDEWSFQEVLPSDLLHRAGLLGDDLYFIDSQHEDVPFLGDEIEAFYGLDGQIQLDLSQYTFAEPPSFEAGYCLADLINDAGVRYLTIMDINGTFQFEPIKYTPYSYLSCGLLKLYLERETWMDSMTCIFLDIHGNQVGPRIQARQVYDFSDGFARIVYEGGYIAYMDTQGHFAFTEYALLH